MISDKKDEQIVVLRVHYEWTDRNYKRTDRFYEWTDRNYRWTDEYYECSYFRLFRSTIYGNARSNHRRFSVRRSVLWNFLKFTGKYLCQSLFIDKVAGQPFLQNNSGRLPLKCLKKISKRKLWPRLLF